MKSVIKIIIRFVIPAVIGLLIIALIALPYVAKN